MNGVDVLNTVSTSAEAYISNMPVHENVVASEETVMDLTRSTPEEGMANEANPEQDLESLKITLQHQLEYYFSSENLTRDQYLVSQMDDQHYVPIWTIANFNLVKNLTTDINLITEVLKSSSLVQVDEKNEKVRPNQTKYVLILREIPEDTPIKNVEGLFEGDECPRFISCEFAANTSWYVTFETENDAQAAYRHLREKVKTFLGQPIMARIKSRTRHLSTFGSSKISQSKPPQVSMPGQIVSPTYIPASFVPQPGATFPAGPGGQQPPFIAAIATQPQGATSPSSSVSTSVAPVLVMPHGGQPWPGNLYPTPEHMGYGNQPFANPVFHQVSQPNYMPSGKGNAMYRNRNYLNNNYNVSSDMQAGRNMQPDNHVMQMPMNPSSTDSHPRYLPAVGPIPTNVYTAQGMYVNKNQSIMNKPNGNKQNGSMSNGAGRYNNRNFSGSYHQLHESDIGPRFQKKGNSRYSTSRNANSQDLPNRHNSEGGLIYHNGPSNVPNHETYHYMSRNNSTGHDPNTVPGSLLGPGPRRGYLGQKLQNQDYVIESSGAYIVGDVNNNAAKRQIFTDTVSNSDPNSRISAMSNRNIDPKLRRNGRDSRGNPSQQSALGPVINGTKVTEAETFNLEKENKNSAFPPLCGSASNSATNPISTTTDTVVKKPQVPEESYKNSLKMNLDKGPISSAPVMTSSTTTTQTTTAPAAARSHPIAKEKTMQCVAKDETLKKDATHHSKDFHRRHIPQNTSSNHHHPVKSPNKTPKAVESQRHSATASDTKRQSHEKSNKSSQKHHSRTHKSNTTVENNNKSKSEPTTTKPNTSDQNTVPSADSDAGKKLSYAEMLRRQTPKQPIVSIVDENENHIDGKREQLPEEPRHTASSTTRQPEKTEMPVESKTSEKVPSTPPEDSENGDEKPWESAGHPKRSHRAERASSDHSHHNGYDTRVGGHQRGGRNSSSWGGKGGNRGKGRVRGGSYGRGGPRQGYGGRGGYNSAASERSSATSNGDLPQRKRQT